VQLEKGGQSATSGADGSFTLIISSAVLFLNGVLLPSGLSAKLLGNVLNVTIAEKVVFEIASIDLTGKTHSTVRQTLNAGDHIIALPQQGSGLYFYHIKAGHNKFALKGISINGLLHGTCQGTCSNSALTKPATTTATINDVLAVSKIGYLNYRTVIGTSDTTGLDIRIIASAGSVADVDGNVYQTVKIGNQVWMAENLATTKYNDGTPVTLDTSTEAWGMETKEKYCYYNNTTNADSIKKFGALYNWEVVNPANPRKIAPSGWHLPSDSDWDTLQNFLIAKGYNWDATTTGNKIAKSLAAKADWVTSSTPGTIGCDLTKNNSSGFSALPGGFRSVLGDFCNLSNNGYWWSATEYDAGAALARRFFHVSDNLYRRDYIKSCGFSVRLLKD
jgi:uncharacterized protein (TIGR02145 family)